MGSCRHTKCSHIELLPFVCTGCMGARKRRRESGRLINGHGEPMQKQCMHKAKSSARLPLILRSRIVHGGKIEMANFRVHCQPVNNGESSATDQQLVRAPCAQLPSSNSRTISNRSPNYSCHHQCLSTIIALLLRVFVCLGDANSMFSDAISRFCRCEI